jgi:hypothetical protein
MRYWLSLLVLWSFSSLATEEKQAQDYLTKAVMKVPMIKEKKKEVEGKFRDSDLNFLLYAGPFLKQTVRFHHENFTYQYELRDNKIVILYRIDF